MADPVKRERVDTRVTEERFEARAGGRVTFEHRPDVAA
jgi:hypothetical protein